MTDDELEFCTLCGPLADALEMLDEGNTAGARAIMSLEQTGTDGSSVDSTLWLKKDDHTPVRGEIAVDGKIILQAEFTDFQFGAILNGDSGAAAG